MDWWLFAFFIGAILSLFLPIEPTSFYFFILIVFALSCYFYKPLMKSSGLFLGGAWMLFNGIQYQNIWQTNQLDINALVKDVQQVQGEVLSLSTLLLKPSLLPVKTAASRQTLLPESVKNDSRQRFNLKVVRLNNQGVKVPFIVRLSWKNPDINLAQGQYVTLQVKFKPAHGLANHGGFGYQTWLRSNNIVATGYVVNRKNSNKNSNQVINNKRSIRQTLFANYHKMLQQLPVKQQSLAPLLLALGFGDRSLLSSSVWKILQTTGTGHLIAISGLHIGLVASGVFFLVIGFIRYFPLALFFSVLRLRKETIYLVAGYLQCINIRYFAITLSLFSAFGYGYLAGFSLPTIRALVMLSLYWIARLMGIHLSIKRWFLLALLVLVLITPFSVFTGSFWLSCYAVVIIFITLWRFQFFLQSTNHTAGNDQKETFQGQNSSTVTITEGEAGSQHPLNHASVSSFHSLSLFFPQFVSLFFYLLLHLMKGLIIIQLALLLLLMPLSALLFQQVSVVAFLANMLAVPFMSFIVIPLCLLSIVFLFINDSIALILMSLAVHSLQLLWQWLSYLAEFSWSMITINHSQLVLLFFGVAIAIILIFSWKRAAQLMPYRFVSGNNIYLARVITLKMVTLVFFGLIFVVTLYIVTPFNKKENKSPWQLVMMDVGQGLSMLIIRDQQAILYDTGASYSTGFNMAEAVVVPYLKYRGINKLDKVILSHSDNDHAGSLAQLQNHIAIDKLMTNATFAKKIIGNSLPFSSLPFNVEVCMQGQSFSWQGLTFRQLWPEVQTVNQLSSGIFLKASNELLKDKNDDSCVIEISDGHHKVLLTGDVSNKVEKSLLKKYPHLTADVLLVPHHGSNTSSSAAFIAMLSPSIALVSAGYLNRWNMPTPKTVKRYQSHHLSIINTAKVGEVTLTFYEPRLNHPFIMQTITQQSYRENFWPFWFAN